MSWTKKEKRLLTAIGLASVFIAVEVIGGAIAHSLAIFSDAAHLLSDVAGFGIALVAALSSKAAGSKHYTYGLVRADVFGAIISIFFLWAITIWLVIEAGIRAYDWFHGQAVPVDGKIMFFIAIFGVCVNLLLAVVFHEEHEDSFHLHGHDHSHDHDHGHGGHDGHAHGHAHGHGSSCGSKYQSVDDHDDVESGHGHEHEHGHDHGSCGGNHSARDHDHGHDHGHTSVELEMVEMHGDHDHGHDHGHTSEKTSLLGSAAASASSSSSSSSSSAVASYGASSSVDDHTHSGHDHGHDHGHGSSCSSSHTAAATAPTATAKPKDANLEAAYLHVLTDLMQSVGVALAGALIWYRPTWQIIDPCCTFGFSILVLLSTVPLMKKLLTILLEGTPEHINWKEVETKLRAIPGVLEVHDLHIWNLSSQTVALTAHIKAHDPQRVLKLAHKVCSSFEIGHATIQVQCATEAVQCFTSSCNTIGQATAEGHDSLHHYACVSSKHAEL